MHPNIITVHATGQDRGFHFLEMEFVPGGRCGSLSRTNNGSRPLRATALAARIADGLAEAHRHGIIHRDLKPDNVLMTLQGVPKLADFGLAKRVVPRREVEPSRRAVRNAAIHGPRTVSGSRSRAGHRRVCPGSFLLSDARRTLPVYAATR